MTPEQQLDEWVKGNPIHDDEGEGQCCPDFSCCQPELLAPLEARIAFRDANEEERFAMLGHFLSAGLAKALEGKEDVPAVYIAGDTAREH